jgi:glutathione S-transferase
MAVRSKNERTTAILMTVLHHHLLSAGSRYVRLLLGEYGEEVALVDERPWERREAFLALNPAGTLPVLVDHEDTVIAGAAVIAEYLHETRGARAGEPVLLPSNPADRAEIRRLVAWFLGKFDGEVTAYLVNEKVFKRQMNSGPGSEPDSAAIRAARSNIRYHLRYIGHLMERRKWLGGEEMSLADLAAAAELSAIDYLGEVPWEEDTHAKDWYARIKSRPSFRPVLTDLVRGNPPATHYADLDF